MVQRDNIFGGDWDRNVALQRGREIGEGEGDGDTKVFRGVQTSPHNKTKIGRMGPDVSHFLYCNTQ